MNNKLFLGVALLLLSIYSSTPELYSREYAFVETPLDALETLLWDDFNGTSLNGSIWYSPDQYQISNSILTLTSGYLNSKNGIDNEAHTLDIRLKVNSKTGVVGWWGIEPWGNTEMGPDFSYENGKLEACSEYNGLYDYYDCSTVSSFDGTVWHDYKIEMQNGVARLYVDGDLVHEGNTWDCAQDFDSECHIYAQVAQSKIADIDFIRYSTGGTPQCYLLTASITPPNGGTVSASPPPNCAGGKYSAGTQVTLTATPAAGYAFAGWSGSLTGSQNPKSLTIDGNKSVTANFSQQCYTLTTSVSPTGGGSVGVSPTPNCSGGKYTAGTQVTLTATPAAGYAFASWSGSLTGSQNPKSLTIDGNKSVTANFSSTIIELQAGNFELVDNNQKNFPCGYQGGLIGFLPDPPLIDVDLFFDVNHPEDVKDVFLVISGRETYKKQLNQIATDQPNRFKWSISEYDTKKSLTELIKLIFDMIICGISTKLGTPVCGVGLTITPFDLIENDINLEYGKLEKIVLVDDNDNEHSFSYEQTLKTINDRSLRGTYTCDPGELFCFVPRCDMTLAAGLSPVDILVIDEEGNRTGQSYSQTHIEIPNSLFIQDEEEYVIVYEPGAGSNFDLLVQGTDTGEYDILLAYLGDHPSNSQGVFEQNLNTELGEVHSYSIETGNSHYLIFLPMVGE